jgi:hypothetical protein
LLKNNYPVLSMFIEQWPLLILAPAVLLLIAVLALITRLRLLPIAPTIRRCGSSRKGDHFDSGVRAVLGGDSGLLDYELDSSGRPATCHSDRP